MASKVGTAATALTWSDKENAYKCAHCRAPTPGLNLRCKDCQAVAYCGEACKRADAGAHARACKALAAAKFADDRGLAEKGNVVSMFNVGVAYSRGLGVEQSYAEAAVWYRRAAEKGFAGARYNLACFYRDGRGGGSGARGRGRRGGRG
jgi:TPR repeat protein